MFNFIGNKGSNKSAPIAAAPDVETLTQQLTNAIKAQFINGNITAAELQKLVQLANDGARLRGALKFL